MSLTAEAFEALEAIEQVSSTNKKKEILNDNYENNILFDLLYWTYNPFYHYYMNSVEIPNTDVVESVNGYSRHICEFKRILSRLNARRISGNNAKDVVYKFLEKCDSVEIKWYVRVLTRDLRCGISVTTINNVYGDVIKTFPVALAENPEIRVYPPNFRIDPKFDGYRCLTETLTPQMFSRNGNELNGYDELLHIIDVCGDKDSDVFTDGELISADFKGTQNNAFRKSGGKRANYYVFDLISRHDFYEQNGGMPLEKRQGNLKAYVELLKANAERKGIDASCIVEVIPIVFYYHNIMELRSDFAEFYDHKKLKYVNPTQSMVDSICDEAYEFALLCGYEGVVVKDLDSLYMVGKSYSSECVNAKRRGDKWYSWAKRKPTDTLDLVVDSVYEGTGQNVGKLGGVNVIYHASDGKDYFVGVGSGFKKDEREKYWQNKNLIIGKTIEVEYDIETQDADGNYSLRFPRFKKVRKDK